MHLLLGDPADSCCTGVLARLAARGLPARIVPAPLAPPARLVWRLDANGPASRLVLDDGSEPEIAGVLVRGTGWVDPAGWDPDDHAYVQAETMAATLAWLESLPCPVVNRTPAALWYRPRAPLILWRAALRRAGLAVADTLFTNDPAEARRFRDRLAAAGIAGAIYAPMTGDAGYPLADAAAWDGLAGLQARAPVGLTEPHGAVSLACVVGGRVLWDDDAAPEPRALAPALLRLAADAGLAFLQIALAPSRRGLGVVALDPLPELDHFAAATRERILDALTLLLAPSPVRQPEALP